MSAHGAVGGWRWWVVDDGDERWLVYDNRPMLEDWEMTSFEQTGVIGQRRACPAFVHGQLPMDVAVAAAVES
jgi:hypothetical protein